MIYTPYLSRNYHEFKARGYVVTAVRNGVARMIKPIILKPKRLAELATI